MTQKHTPAPWAVESGHAAGKPDYFNGMLRIKALSTDETIMDINTHMGFVANKGSKGFANARLIAAAPELLEALKEAEKWLSEHTVCWDSAEGQKIRKAIAKAEGK